MSKKTPYIPPEIKPEPGIKSPDTIPETPPLQPPVTPPTDPPYIPSPEPDIVPHPQEKEKVKKGEGINLFFAD
jgi:hypothetical protein